MSSLRDRADRCPGVLRPWPAEDGLLVRLRLIGGRITTDQLLALLDVAETYGDGRLRPTTRANLQLRALPGGESLSPEVVAAIEETGLLPSRTHELARNVMVSPQSGLAGGRADLRPVAARFDALLRSNADLAGLPGRFLVVLDDGRGDLVSQSSDLAAVALDEDSVQLRVGDSWGPVVPIDAAAAALITLAEVFAHVRGAGPDAPWHIAELTVPLLEAATPDPRLPTAAPTLPFGTVPGGRHVEVPETGLARAAVVDLIADVDHLIVTPWRGILVPEDHR